MNEENREAIKKKVDEAWKEAVSKEKDETEKPAHQEIEVNFGIFTSGLAMESMVALGEIENPITKKKEFNSNHAKFLIDTLAMLQEKTKNNLTKEEGEMLDYMLYDLRMRFVNKMKGG